MSTTDRDSTAHLRSSDASQSLRMYVRHAWQRRHFGVATKVDTRVLLIYEVVAAYEAS